MMCFRLSQSVGTVPDDILELHPLCVTVNFPRCLLSHEETLAIHKRPAKRI